MQGTRVAPLVGIVGCLFVVVGLAVPYGFETAPGTTVGLYYGSGAVTPLVAGAFALLTVIVLAAGREERTDPQLAAGVGLALGFFATLVVAVWALTVPQDVAAGLSTSSVAKQHRWILVAVTLVVPAASTWWARSLGVL